MGQELLLLQVLTHDGATVKGKAEIMAKLSSIVELHMAFGMSYRAQHIDTTPWTVVKHKDSFSCTGRWDWNSCACKLFGFPSAMVCTVMRQSSAYAYLKQHAYQCRPLPAKPKMDIALTALHLWRCAPALQSMEDSVGTAKHAEACESTMCCRAIRNSC